VSERAAGKREAHADKGRKQAKEDGNGGVDDVTGHKQQEKRVDSALARIDSTLQRAVRRPLSLSVSACVALDVFSLLVICAGARRPARFSATANDNLSSQLQSFHLWSAASVRLSCLRILGCLV
jgi:hypothetical protein